MKLKLLYFLTLLSDVSTLVCIFPHNLYKSDKYINTDQFNNVIKELDSKLWATDNIFYPSKIEIRIKSKESIQRKMETRELNKPIYDMIGIRYIYNFLNDESLYQAIQYIKTKMNDLICIEDDDYIAFPKKNGYRAYHIHFYICEVFVELQILTEKMYNYNINGPPKLYYLHRSNTSISQLNI